MKALLGTAALVASLSAFAACAAPRPGNGFEPNEVDKALRAGMRRGAGARIALDSLGPDEWQYFYVFGPGTGVDVMRRCLGESHGFETFGVDRRDDIGVLVFRSGTGELSSMDVSRDVARFSDDAANREYPRGDARFVVRRNRGNQSLELAPADTSARRCS